jgi:hypothetical protein
MAPRARLPRTVGPAAIIGHRLPAEGAGDRIARRSLEIGIVDQEDGDLAGQVDALEVVPLPLGRGDAVADEHHRRVLDAGAVGFATVLR